MSIRFSPGPCGCCDVCLPLHWRTGDGFSVPHHMASQKDGSGVTDYGTLSTETGYWQVKGTVSGDIYLSSPGNSSIYRWSCNYDEPIETYGLTGNMGGGFDVDEVNERFFYYPATGDVVRRLDFDGTDTSIVAFGASVRPIINFDNDLLYLFSTSSNYIYTVEFDGTNLTAIHAAGDNFWGKAIGNGKLFVSTFQSIGGGQTRHRLVTLDYDGNNYTIIRDLTDTAANIVDGEYLALSVDDTHIYAYRGNTAATAGYDIVRMEYNGDNEEIIVAKEDTGLANQRGVTNHSIMVEQ